MARIGSLLLHLAGMPRTPCYEKSPKGGGVATFTFSLSDELRFTETVVFPVPADRPAPAAMAAFDRVLDFRHILPCFVEVRHAGGGYPFSRRDRRHRAGDHE